MTQDRPTKPTKKSPSDMNPNYIKLLKYFDVHSETPFLDGACKVRLLKSELRRDDERLRIIVPVRSSANIGFVDVDFDCVLGVLENPTYLSCCAYFPFRVPIDRCLSFAEFCVRASRELPIGRFDLNMDDGEFRFQTRALCGSDGVSESLVKIGFDFTALTADLYLKPFMDVLFTGISPKDALEAAGLNSAPAEHAYMGSFIHKRNRRTT